MASRVSFGRCPPKKRSRKVLGRGETDGGQRDRRIGAGLSRPTRTVVRSFRAADDDRRHRTAWLIDRASGQHQATLESNGLLRAELPSQRSRIAFVLVGQPAHALGPGVTRVDFLSSILIRARPESVRVTSIGITKPIAVDGKHGVGSPPTKPAGVFGDEQDLLRAPQLCRAAPLVGVQLGRVDRGKRRGVVVVLAPLPRCKDRDRRTESAPARARRIAAEWTEPALPPAVGPPATGVERIRSPVQATEIAESARPVSQGVPWFQGSVVVTRCNRPYILRHDSS